MVFLVKPVNNSIKERLRRITTYNAHKKKKLKIRRFGRRSIQAILKWLGHVLRMSPDKNPKIPLTWTPEDKCRKRRPREKGRRIVDKERTQLGFRTCREAETAA